MTNDNQNQITIFRQELKCIYDDARQRFVWNASIETCEQIQCQAPPNLPTNAEMTIKPGMDPTNEKAYQTEISYTCPSKSSSNEMMYFAFNYTSLSLVKSVKMVCEVDGLWSVNSPLAEERFQFTKLSYH